MLKHGVNWMAEGLNESIDRILEYLIGQTWVELLEDAPEVMFAQHDITIARDCIINLLANPKNKAMLGSIIELAEAEAEEYSRPDNQGD